MEATQPSTEPKKRYINVNEIFGPTIQGEGTHTGERCAFLRVAGCNLSCVWCDTPYSWDWERYDRNEESHPTAVEDIASQINAMRVNRLIISGGEPMLQQHYFGDIKRLTGCKIDVETNGTILPKPATELAVDHFTVSPKLAHAGDPEAMRIKPAVLQRFSQLAMTGRASFKFVAESEEDFKEIDKFLKLGDIPDQSVYIMAEGITVEAQLKGMRKIADAVIKRGWNLSSRLHVLIWETERAK